MKAYIIRVYRKNTFFEKVRWLIKKLSGCMRKKIGKSYSMLRQFFTGAHGDFLQANFSQKWPKSADGPKFYLTDLQ